MSHTLTEGGQITSHRFRMLRQVIKTAIFLSLIVSLSIFCFSMYKVPKVYYLSSLYHAKALIAKALFNEIEVSREFLAQYGYYYNKDQTMSVSRILALTGPAVSHLFNIAYEQFMRSMIVAGICTSSVLAFFFIRGCFSKSKKHISGSKVVSNWRLKMVLKFKGKNSDIQLGSVPLIKGSETQHLLITGGSGSGKTNCLHHLLSQIREKKQKTIIVDTTGIFVKTYYREGKDILLNPYDPRSAEWNPWAEGCSLADYASLAEAFIPVNYSESDSYWRLASKSVFIGLLERFSDKKNTSEIMTNIQYEKLAILCKMMENTRAAAHLDISSERTASSVRSVTCSYLECLGCLKDTQSPFSIRQWIENKDDSWLFLQCEPSERALLRPLMTAWVSAAVRGLLGLQSDLTRRIWFIMDELPTLQRVKDLEMLLTEGRKYGGCGVISLQSPAQLENIYGREVSKVIIGNTATKVIFRERDPEIAEQISRAFGEREVLETQEGITYGAHESRDGVSLSIQNRTRRVVSASQIIDLPINSAYLRLSEGKAVAKITLPIWGKLQK